jgi:hypothetical protein
MKRSFFKRVEKNNSRKDTKKKGTCVSYAQGPIKGFERAMEYCESRGIKPKIIKDLQPEEVLEVFEKTSQFVFLPEALEPAGRMPVEARFMGCTVVVNECVGVAGEPWWNLDDESALKFVQDIPDRFWRLVKHIFDRKLGQKNYKR